SDVCSSDLARPAADGDIQAHGRQPLASRAHRDLHPRQPRHRAHQETHAGPSQIDDVASTSPHPHVLVANSRRPSPNQASRTQPPRRLASVARLIESWIERATSAPSPTAAATRLVEPARTSPTANTSRLVDSRSSGVRSVPPQWPAKSR